MEKPLKNIILSNWHFAARSLLASDKYCGLSKHFGSYDSNVHLWSVIEIIALSCDVEWVHGCNGCTEAVY